MAGENVKIPLSKEFQENVDYLVKQMRVEESFDLLHHKIEVGGRKISMFLVDGFVDDQAMTRVLQNLHMLDDDVLRSDPIDTLMKRAIPHQETETADDLEDIITQVLSGQAAMIVEGCTEAVIVDTREYPARTPEEPDLERVVRGPREGFIETLVFNAALIRRRVRDRSLVMDYVQVGQRSKTDIVLSYIDSIADANFIEMIKKEIEKIDIDGLSMGEKTLEEYIFGKSYNPYPLVRYTERGDTAGVHLMEGHILIVVDGSPSVMICPTTFWHHLQHAEEYRQKPIIGAALRWVRFAAVLSALFVMPLWYIYDTHRHIVPVGFDFIGVDDPGAIPIIWQFLIAELGVEMLRMAAIHTPNALATALGLVAALLIGEIAVEVGLFTAEVILYLAAAVIGGYATPSYELNLANRFFRVVFLIIAATFGPTGLIIGVTVWLIMLATTKGLNTPFMWPFIPFSPTEFVDVLVRSPIPLSNTRPSIVKPKDKTRQ